MVPKTTQPEYMQSDGRVERLRSPLQNAQVYANEYEVHRSKHKEMGTFPLRRISFAVNKSREHSPSPLPLFFSSAHAAFRSKRDALRFQLLSRKSTGHRCTQKLNSCPAPCLPITNRSLIAMQISPCA